MTRLFGSEGKYFMNVQVITPRLLLVNALLVHRLDKICRGRQRRFLHCCLNVTSDRIPFRVRFNLALFQKKNKKVLTLTVL